MIALGLLGFTSFMCVSVSVIKFPWVQSPIQVALCFPPTNSPLYIAVKALYDVLPPIPLLLYSPFAFLLLQLATLFLFFSSFSCLGIIFFLHEIQTI